MIESAALKIQIKGARYPAALEKGPVADMNHRHLGRSGGHGTVLERLPQGSREKSASPLPHRKVRVYGYSRGA